jgi:hypothetical protein
MDLQSRRQDLRLFYVGQNSRVSHLTGTILALGIGASTATFGIVDAYLRRPLPHARLFPLARLSQKFFEWLPIVSFPTCKQMVGGALREAGVVKDKLGA